MYSTFKSTNQESLKTKRVLTKKKNNMALTGTTTGLTGEDNQTYSSWHVLIINTLK